MSNGKQGPQAIVPKVNPQPDDHTEDHREKEWFAHANMGGRSAAEIARQQDRAEDRCARNRIDDRAADFENRDSSAVVCGITKFTDSLFYGSRVHRAIGS